MSAAARLRRRALAAALAGLACVTAGRALAAAPAGLTLRLVRDTTGADPLGPVAVQVSIVNGSDHPVFVDSLRLERAPRAAGAAASAQTLPVPQRPNGIAEADSQVVSIALAPERADQRATLRFFLHRLHEDPFELAETLELAGVDPVRLYRPRIVNVAGRETELAFVPASGPADRGAGLLLLRDPDGTLEADVLAAATLARSGISVLIVSPPGCGGSRGPADYAGPTSLAAARAALDTLARMPGVSPTRLAAWGTGWGGTLALLLAESRTDLRAAVAQSAHADPWATVRASGPAFAKTFTAAAGRDSAGWKARSPFAGVTFLRSKVLLLHGEDDKVAPAAAMWDFMATAHRVGIEMTGTFLPQVAHAIAPAEAVRRVRLFVQTNTREPAPH